MNQTPENQVTEKMLEAAKDYADLIVKEPLGQLGGILADTIGYWRQMNQVKLLLRARDFMVKSGINPRKILPDVFVSILNEGSYKSDDALNDMYAALLAAHLESQDDNAVHPAYCKVLSEMSPLDASLLKYFSKFSSLVGEGEGQYPLFSRGLAVIAADNQISEKIAYLACENLSRLSLLENRARIKHPDKASPEEYLRLREYRHYRITDFGLHFYTACSRNDTSAGDGASANI